MPVLPTTPPVVASPNAWVAASSSRHSRPGPATAVRTAGSIRVAFIGGQVDHQRPVGDGEAGRGVPAAADADRQALLAGETDRR